MHCASPSPLHSVRTAFQPAAPRAVTASRASKLPDAAIRGNNHAVNLQGQPAAATLRAGHALTLAVRQPGMLRLTQGRVWLTFSHADKDARAGDHFLQDGESLALAPGDSAVIEPYAADRAASAADFSWEPACAMAGSWHGAVAQPLRDLRAALGLAADALGRLVQGVGRSLVASWH
ncbi:MAG: hypothetical protein JWR60_1666 [Polaromonas sp.]|nr:hypothetical protein [Polaromonas sp.]